MKRILSLMLALVLCLSLSACGSTESQPGSQPNTGESSVIDNTPVISVGEVATTEKCEFTVDYVNITGDVVPPQPGDWYSHYEAEAGKVYVDICFAYKNTSNESVEVTFTIDGNTYTYKIR